MRAEANGRTILIGEDEPEVRSYLEMALRCQGFSVETAEDGQEVITSLRESRNNIAAVLLDIFMPHKDGLETLREIRNLFEDLPVIMVSGASSPLNVVEAMRSGANDFLGKPVNHEDLRKALQRALDKKQPVTTVVAPERIAPPNGSKEVCFGASPQMRELESQISQVGWSEAPVLIQGETGVGKEVLARQLHANSPRAHKPLLKLNCAALPSELVESELFGYERGAFTGAFQRKLGMFELADGGTIFLDEIGDMDFKLQAKLLQVLQDYEFQRLGGKETIRVDVRVISATHNDLEKASRTRTFREDLYYRLNVVTMRLPALRERKSDILPLAEFLLRRHTAAGSPAPAITPALRQALENHEWPGNIRELENIMRRLIVLRAPDRIVAELQAKISNRTLSESVQLIQKPAAQEPVAASAPILEQVTKAKNQAETEAILAALNSTRWNRKRAATMLKIDYKALLYKMKKLEIEEKAAVLTGS